MSKPVDSDNSTSQPLHNLIVSARKQSSLEASPSRFNRRHFIQGVSASTASVALVGCFSNNNNASNQGSTTSPVTFTHGVASGDPLSDRVILWTRVVPNFKQPLIKVKWRIATDQAMTSVVNQGEGLVRASDDYTFKVDADGLKPNQQYYYQFESIGVKSRIGKTKTLPVGDVQQVKMAVFSCANYPAGYFHVYADVAKRGDVDVCIHLGDYIYEYGRTTLVKDENGLTTEKIAYASANAASLDREVEPANEIVGISDYRRRYAQYRSDKDLQDLHANVAMIAVWDDHEFCNDAYRAGGENHNEGEGDWQERKLAAMTAYHEWLPTRNTLLSDISRRFDFGNLLSLHMLDTRIAGRDKPLDYANYVTPTGLNGLQFIADLFSKERQLLGLNQQNWLAQQMSQSTATWQVLGQQIIMGKMWIPAPILLNFNNPKTGVDMPTYMAILLKSKKDPSLLTEMEKKVLSHPYIPYNLDAWDGYAVAREHVYAVSRSLNKNLVVLAGDTHNAWANNLQDKDGNAIGVEFATSSVSSPGFEEYLPNANPTDLAAALPLLVQGGTLKYTDTSRRGYILLTVTPTQCQSEWVFVSDILKPTYSAEVGKTLSVKVGENMITDA